ncbi:MAG: hypothetical protein DCF25_05255 [Leptolyngbya foveolarum]|uniref:Putative restriction endonuclease domain-containing protein n=1 Tax=Leptolyngbya foveolarum TaxID=47253 RepID=A0A2W4UWE1_9CYAN|nr:MAG: hypothetical protein DCF25_05255 [Leptolyngbya foveolarum]
MVQAFTKPILLSDFLALPEAKPTSEFVDGQIIQKPMPQGQHSTIQGALTTQINAVTQIQKTAWAFPELRCTFGGRSIVPDIAVFSWESIPTNEDGTVANQFNQPPNWTIEILSPGQSSTRVTSNILHCLNYGATLGWLVDPAEKIVLVYRSEQTPLSLEKAGDHLIMPTFANPLQLAVQDLFGYLRVT